MCRVQSFLILIFLTPLLILYVRCGGDRLTGTGKSAGGNGDVNGALDGGIAAEGDGEGTGQVVGNFDPNTCMIKYPFASANPRTNVVFNESDVLVFPNPGVLRADGTIRAYYSDEHALMLGLRAATEKKTDGSTNMISAAISMMSGNPSVIGAPQVGILGLTGPLAGTDSNTCGEADCGRPMFPALFVTDITNDPNSMAGDWQSHGTPIPPDAVLGSWKSATRTFSDSAGTASIAVGSDPPKNNSNIGNNLTVPSGVGSEGYSSEIRWLVGNLGLQSGHIYRAQFMIHDGDQSHPAGTSNVSGGDVGEGCVTINMNP